MEYTPPRTILQIPSLLLFSQLPLKESPFFLLALCERGFLDLPPPCRKTSHQFFADIRGVVERLHASLVPFVFSRASLFPLFRPSQFSEYLSKVPFHALFPSAIVKRGDAAPPRLRLTQCFPGRPFYPSPGRIDVISCRMSPPSLTSIFLYFLPSCVGFCFPLSPLCLSLQCASRSTFSTSLVEDWRYCPPSFFLVAPPKRGYRRYACFCFVSKDKLTFSPTLLFLSPPGISSYIFCIASKKDGFPPSLCVFFSGSVLPSELSPLEEDVVSFFSRILL